MAPSSRERLTRLPLSAPFPILPRMSEAEAHEQKAFADLVAVCRRLRGPGGCPWDQEQTLETMTPYLVEEAAEVGEAIADQNRDGTSEELGDVAFLAIFCLELLADQGGPGLAESLERAAQKLIRRHPHVYGEAQVKDGDAAYRQWQEIKKAEKGASADQPASLLGEQPRGLPALVAAYRLQEKAGAVGFDWPDPSGAMHKVREEVDEIAVEMAGDTTPRLAREVGDLLFAVVNLARKLGVDPERELRAAGHRFRDRFHHIEQRLAERGSSPTRATLEEMDALWEEAKRVLPRPSGSGDA